MGACSACTCSWGWNYAFLSDGIQLLSVLAANESLRTFASLLKIFASRWADAGKCYKAWVAKDVRGWCAYDGVLPGAIADQADGSRAMRKDTCQHQGPDKPCVPANLSAPLQADLRIAFARFRLCASHQVLCKEDYWVLGGLTGVVACAGVQDKIHAVLTL